MAIRAPDGANNDHEVGGAVECALSYLRGTMDGYKEVYTLLTLAFKPT